MDNVQLPTIIYLPSSGGRAGSRITPEVSIASQEAGSVVNLVLSSSLPAEGFHFTAIVFKRTGVWS